MFWLIYTIIFLSLSLMGLNQTNKDNYGPYQLEWHTLETCKGPKQSDCGKFTMENVQNKSDIVFLLDFPKDCPVTSARVTIGTKQKNNSTKKLWNYALDRPCQHFVLGPILVESFNLTNNCKVNKGDYKIHLNFLEKTTMFLGTNFFYGTFAFKTVAYNKMKNFFCVLTVVEVKRLS